MSKLCLRAPRAERLRGQQMGLEIGTPRIVAAARHPVPEERRAPAAPQPGLGFWIIVGAYLHEEPYPEPLAGHSFVAIQDPDGTRRAFGFSPVNFARYDPHRDLEKLTAGVPGLVHDDKGAFEMPGVRTRAFEIGEAQVEAAMARIREYRAGRYRFSLARRQCSAFALDVLRAARIGAFAGPLVRSPRELYYEL